MLITHNSSAGSLSRPCQINGITSFRPRNVEAIKGAGGNLATTQNYTRAANGAAIETNNAYTANKHDSHIYWLFLQ